MQKRVPQDEFTATKFFTRPRGGRPLPASKSSDLPSTSRRRNGWGLPGLFHLIIWIVDVGPDGRCLAVDAGFSRAARLRERKVRTPQSSVPDNVRDVGFKPNGRKVPQKTYRPGLPG